MLLLWKLTLRALLSYNRSENRNRQRNDAGLAHAAQVVNCFSKFAVLEIPATCRGIFRSMLSMAVDHASVVRSLRTSAVLQVGWPAGNRQSQAFGFVMLPRADRSCKGIKTTGAQILVALLLHLDVKTTSQRCEQVHRWGALSRKAS